MRLNEFCAVLNRIRKRKEAKLSHQNLVLKFLTKNLSNVAKVQNLIIIAQMKRNMPQPGEVEYVHQQAPVLPRAALAPVLHTTTYTIA